MPLKNKREATALKVPHSKEVEKRVLAGLLNHGSTIWPEVSLFLNEGDFYTKHYKVNQVIFNVIRRYLDKSETVDTVLVAEKIKDLGIADPDCKIYDYLEGLKHIKLSVEASIQAVKDLKHVTLRREIYETAKKNIDFICSEASECTAEEIITHVDKIHNEKIHSFTINDREPVNLCTNLLDFVEELGMNQKEELGLKTPWPFWNSFYGGLRLGDSYGFAGRAKGGKSTLLMDLAFRTGNKIDQSKIIGQKHVPILFLDTEQEERENRIKLAACIANVDPQLIESGRWRNHPTIVAKVREKLKDVDKMDYHHIYTPRLSIQEIKSLILRHYYNKVGRGNPLIIAYDYVKLSGDDLAKTTKDYLVAAHKLDVLKDLVKEEVNGVLLFGVQRNRSGVGKDASDDETSISLSDNLVQLASYMAIIRKKIPEELAEEGQKHGTHKLITVVARKLGFEGKKNDIIKFNGKWMSNFLNFDFDNYRTNEVSTGQQLADELDLEDGDNSPNKQKPF